MRTLLICFARVENKASKVSLQTFFNALYVLYNVFFVKGADHVLQKLVDV